MCTSARVSHVRARPSLWAHPHSLMVEPSLPHRILLVEPNAALRSAIVSVLEAAQCHVEVCDSLDTVVTRRGDESR